VIFGAAPRIGAVCGGRDNNFNLIRMIAATAVLVSHAWPIARGVGTEEPLERLLGLSLGGVSLMVFFAISGFLIARSYDWAPRIADWTAARVMRLFPGLAVALILTALVLGPAATTLSLGAYAADPATLLYVPRNVTLVSLQYGLPGVFADNPLPSAINGSLWTLFHEAACYVGVLVIGLFGGLRRPRIMVAALAVWAGFYIAVDFTPEAGPMLRLHRLRDLSAPFVIGAAFYVWRDRIPMRWTLGAALAVLAVALRDTPAFLPVFTLALSYGTFLLAWLPGGAIRGWNRLGDYSYEIYIYAFPVQQLCVHAFGPMTPLENIAVAAPITLVLAILSWRLVEGPALATRRRVADLLSGHAPVKGPTP
jgi:peptidoglycan/LPS O-acetylase OafA/YrhL